MRSTIEDRISRREDAGCGIVVDGGQGNTTPKLLEPLVRHPSHEENQTVPDFCVSLCAQATGIRAIRASLRVFWLRM